MGKPAVVEGSDVIRVVIVDDQLSMRWMLRRALRHWTKIEIIGEAADGQQGIDIVRRVEPDLVLVDLDMPIHGGVEMIRSLRSSGDNVRLLALTSNGDRREVANAIQAGADGYVLKGCGADQLHEAVRTVLNGGLAHTPAIQAAPADDVHDLTHKHTRDLALIQTLADAVEARDPSGGGVRADVTRMSIELWKFMTAADPHEDMVYGFMLHDVGKISMPDAVLLKPAGLTPDEVALMRLHTERGVELVKPLGFSDVVLDIIRYHHERWDGQGYPNRLFADQIPFHARVFSVVDAYGAMTSERPYRRGMSPKDAIDEMLRSEGQWDPVVVDAFTCMARERDMI